MTYLNNLNYLYKNRLYEENKNNYALDIINNSSIIKLNEAKDKVNNNIEQIILFNNMPISPPKLKRQENITVSHAKYIINN